MGSPNPCGIGATCQPGFDRSGNDRPVCTCPPGYRGDPQVSCVRGECEQDSECSCPSGYVGDPLTACRPSRRQQTNVVGFSRFKRDLKPFFLLFPETAE